MKLMKISDHFVCFMLKRSLTFHISRVIYKLYSSQNRLPTVVSSKYLNVNNISVNNQRNERIEAIGLYIK